MISAGGADQEVLDTGPNGHSLFTAALLDALQRGEADTRRDGYIVTPDLVSYLISKASNTYQTPTEADLPGHALGEFLFASPVPARNFHQGVAQAGPLRGGEVSPPASDTGSETKEEHEPIWAFNGVTYKPYQYSKNQVSINDKWDWATLFTIQPAEKGIVVNIRGGPFSFPCTNLKIQVGKTKAATDSKGAPLPFAAFIELAGGEMQYLRLDSYGFRVGNHPESPATDPKTLLRTVEQFCRWELHPPKKRPRLFSHPQPS